MSTYLTSLFIKAAQIDRRIEREHKSRFPNWVVLMRLKITRLRLKDKIQSLASRAAPPATIPLRLPASARRG